MAALPAYDESSQELVTAGEVENGAVIEYTRDKNGPYSTNIPTGINAGDYTVWYRVADTDNYAGTEAVEVPGVKIECKQITPIVTLFEYTYLYDGGEKEPKVKDEGDVTILLDTEYVEYALSEDRCDRRIKAKTQAVCLKRLRLSVIMRASHHDSALCRYRKE